MLNHRLFLAMLLQIQSSEVGIPLTLRIPSEIQSYPSTAPHIHESGDLRKWLERVVFP
jgi:hypothetical protein